MLLVDGSGTVIASKTTMFYQDELGGGLHTGGAIFSILHSSQFNGLLCGIWLVYWTNCPFFLLPEEMLANQCISCYPYVLYGKSITCK